MTRERTLRPELLGDPVTEARATFELDGPAVAAMLTAPAFGPTLDLLGVAEPDRSELLALVPAVVADDEVLGAVVDEANRLRRAAGLRATAPDIADRADALNALQERIAPGQGLIAILAHTVSTDVVRAWHAARGLTPEESWGALADLGQQMRVHRLTFGALGHHTLSWTAMNWAGRLFWHGRLQYDLHHREEEDRWVIGVHIPATGPLEPAEVDASLATGPAFLAERFTDLQGDRPDDAPRFGTELVCGSWLLSPDLPAMLPATSNLVAFQRRWSIVSTFPCSDDAVFFVFHRRPPYDVAQIEARTSLERAVVERLRSGEPWRGGFGRLVLDA